MEGDADELDFFPLAETGSRAGGQVQLSVYVKELRSRLKALGDSSPDGISHGHPVPKDQAAG